MALLLTSYLAGRWVSGSGPHQTLVNPTDGSIVAHCSTEGLDLVKALAFARETGGPSLRALTFAARAALLGKIAEVLSSQRDRWFEIARINSGNTKSDAAIDIDGSIGTLKYFARLGAGLGPSKTLVDGEPVGLGRDPKCQAIHIGVPVKGVAVHINAYNFPAWGLWEKAAVSLLAGVPVLAKPATATAWLAREMVHQVIESGILPEGSLSIACGPTQDLLDHLRFGDVVCFTGSTNTGQVIRSHPAIVARGVRVNIEADSVNAAILGQDAAANDPTFDFFVREVVREMTVKAGQKCTAIRRILVPDAQAGAAAEAIRAQLEEVRVGDPAGANVTMGPLVHQHQRVAVEEGVLRLAAISEVVFQARPLELVDADAARGAFVGPTLLKVRSQSDTSLANELEVFGPVASLIPYRNRLDAFSTAERGGGSLAASVFSADPAFLSEAALEIAPSHGRILLVDPSIGNSHPGHGIVMPSCTHGGPGRAGGGEELGALRALWLYHQRVAVQASTSVLTNVTANDASSATPAS